MASFGGSIKLTGADEYKSALKQITQSLRETGSELTAVASRYDKNDSSLSTLKAKTTEMTGVLAKQNQAYQQLKSAYDSFSAKVSQQAQAHDKLVQTYEKEKQELENIRKASGESSQAFQDQQAKVNDLATAVAKSSQNMNENEIALSKMKTQLNQAEASVNKTTKEIDELGNETEESGKKAEKSGEGYTVFKNILANLGTQAINSAINGLKNLGSAFVDVGKQALNSYANYEQLTGGVETLFGESAKVVEGYANEAYKTAGLSANEYMETVTSFSASMLQSLDNDTQKSAEYSNRAIIDMSDNANKMGTSMEMIQNAYQGFAKQNYTINLMSA
jgi:chromosome segregation ATPase